MTAMVDDRFARLRSLGYTGTTSDMLLQFYLSHGAVTKTLTDAKREWMLALGVGAGPTIDMWFALLRFLGYTGTIQDMEAQFWKSNISLITGPELIRDGVFNTASGVNWNPGAGWLVQGGVAQATAVAATIGVSQPTTVFVAGKTYRVAYTISGITGGGSVRARINGTTNTLYTARSTNGTFTEDVVTLSNSTGFSFNCVTAPLTCVIDNVSARQVAAPVAVLETFDFTMQGGFKVVGSDVLIGYREADFGTAISTMQVYPATRITGFYVDALDDLVIIEHMNSASARVRLQGTGTINQIELRIGGTPFLLNWDVGTNTYRATSPALTQLIVNAFGNPLGFSIRKPA